jgi:hypothetical protein
MRLIPVLNMLGMACAACTAFAIIANGFQGYLPPGRPTALPYGLSCTVRSWLGGGSAFLCHRPSSLQPAFS